jgi:YD repeat-containing protein
MCESELSPSDANAGWSGIQSMANIDSDGDPRQALYGYDASCQMTQTADPAGNMWSWAFDVLGHQTKAVDPDTGTTTSTYDDAGNVLTTTDARGVSEPQDRPIPGLGGQQRIPACLVGIRHDRQGAVDALS